MLQADQGNFVPCWPFQSKPSRPYIPAILPPPNSDFLTKIVQTGQLRPSNQSYPQRCHGIYEHYLCTLLSIIVSTSVLS